MYSRWRKQASNEWMRGYKTVQVSSIHTGGSFHQWMNVSAILWGHDGAAATREQGPSYDAVTLQARGPRRERPSRSTRFGFISPQNRAVFIDHPGTTIHMNGVKFCRARWGIHHKRIIEIAVGTEDYHCCEVNLLYRGYCICAPSPARLGLMLLLQQFPAVNTLAAKSMTITWHIQRKMTATYAHSVDENLCNAWQYIAILVPMMIKCQCSTW